MGPLRVWNSVQERFRDNQRKNKIICHRLILTDLIERLKWSGASKNEALGLVLYWPYTYQRLIQFSVAFTRPRLSVTGRVSWVHGAGSGGGLDRQLFRLRQKVRSVELGDHLVHHAVWLSAVLRHVWRRLWLGEGWGMSGLSGETITLNCRHISAYMKKFYSLVSLYDNYRVLRNNSELPFWEYVRSTIRFATF